MILVILVKLQTRVMSMPPLLRDAAQDKTSFHQTTAIQLSSQLKNNRFEFVIYNLKKTQNVNFNWVFFEMIAHICFFSICQSVDQVSVAVAFFLKPSCAPLCDGY